MNKKQKIVLLIGLATIVLMMIVPPIRHTVTYQAPSDKLSFRGAIHYEFLFTESIKEIHTNRLFLQCIIVSIITVGIISSCRQEKGYFGQLEQCIEQLTCDLASAKEQLQHELSKRKRVEENPYESTILVEEPIGIIEPFDPEKLKGIAELAKRLA